MASINRSQDNSSVRLIITTNLTIKINLLTKYKKM